MNSDPHCRGCHRVPHEIKEYRDRWEREEGYYSSPADLVRRDEGTYNRTTAQFWCTSCYFERGMPSGTA